MGMDAFFASNTPMDHTAPTDPRPDTHRESQPLATAPNTNANAMPRDTAAECDIERRLTDLEIKASFSEDLVDELNLVIVRQQQQIDQLIVELTHLRAQQQASEPGGFRSLRDELPPHY
ncbi:MAG: hypothetical protein RLZZ618_3706 [Pseudomonadota bacterium]|jgi:SlyX protein